MDAAKTRSPLPNVRIEARHGRGAPSFTEMAETEFRIGSALGCELRLPGAGVPPVACTLNLKPDGVRLHKITVEIPVLVNGQPVSFGHAALLSDGDTVTVAKTDIRLGIDMPIRQPEPISVPQTVYTAPPAPVPAPMPEPVLDKHPPVTVPEPVVVDTSREGELIRLQAEREAELKKLQAEHELEWKRLQAEMQAERERQLKNAYAEVQSEREAQLKRAYAEMEADRESWIAKREAIEAELNDHAERERRLKQGYAALEADRLSWFAKRDDIENQLRHAREMIAGELQKKIEIDERLMLLDRKQDELRDWRDKLAGHQGELERLRAEVVEREAKQAEREKAFADEMELRRTEIDAELQRRRDSAEREWRIWIEQKDTGYAQFRTQLDLEYHESYRKRGEELDRFQLSLRETAAQLREQRNAHMEQVRLFEPRWKEMLEREEDHRRREESLEQRYGEWRERMGVVAEREKEIADRLDGIAAREAALVVDAASADELKQKFHTNLLRLGELQLELEDRDKRLAGRAAEVDIHWERFRADTGNFELQAREVAERRDKVIADEAALAERFRIIEDREAGLNQRLSQIETQQATLTTLRMKLERERDEMQRQGARLTEERVKQEEYAKEAREKLREAESIKESLATKQVDVTEGQKLFEERAEMMNAAMARLRALQDQLSDQDTDLRRREEEVRALQAELGDDAGMVKARAEQLADWEKKLEDDRTALRAREADLALADEPRRVLQEHLRRRSEELALQQRQLAEKAGQLDHQTKLLAEQGDVLEALRQDANEVRRLSESQLADLAAKDASLQAQGQMLKEYEETIASQKRELEKARELLAADHRLSQEQTEEVKVHIKSLHEGLLERADTISGKIPEFESRLRTALDRTAQVRDQLRGQLAELHTYARQSQEELETIRGQLGGETDQIRQQETSLNRARAEHRHSVASFKQQLLEWQSRFADLRHAMAQNQSRVGKQAATIEITQLELSRKSELLERDRKVVAEQRGDLDRHLTEMRDWYRQKLRDLVEAGHLRDEDDAPGILPLIRNEEVNEEELDAGDRKLGELLRANELVDAETLNALWTEARRQRKPLRQVLLATNALTVYQMALIESGNLAGLVLGRFRVFDRLPSNSKEALYRVYDPQGLADSGRAGESGPEGICLLRHLSDSEMEDAIRPDEFRERFRVARDLAHPNLRATYEVLEVAGRPAVLQEWSSGLPSDEWPALAASPGVWFRLVSQTALAVYTAAQAGLHHGRLKPECVFLDSFGRVKVEGFGEPAWLHGDAPEATAADDLKALGTLIAGWADLNKRRKKFPDAVQEIFRKLGAEDDSELVYTSAAELLDALERVGSDIPNNADAWDKLLKHVAGADEEMPRRKVA